MKNKIIIMFFLILCINSCRNPAKPMGEIKILNRLDIIETGGNCLDVEVDIEDSIVVVAANYNGYFVHKIISSKTGIVQRLEEVDHVGIDGLYVGNPELDSDQGNNRLQTIDLSIENDIAFIMDQYDHIWLYKYGEGDHYVDNTINENDCYSGTWLDVAIDDQEGRMGVFSLIKHDAANPVYNCAIFDDEDDCTEDNDDLFCIWNNGICQSGNEGDYLEHSTSLVWSNIEKIEGATNPCGNDGCSPFCEYIINQDLIADKIYFNNGLLILGYGELGLRIFEQTDKDACFVEYEDELGMSQDTLYYLQENSIDITLEIDNEIVDKKLCEDFHVFGSEVDYKNCCIKDDCHSGPGNCPEYYDNGVPNVLDGIPQLEGLGGAFSSAGGIIPKICFEEDLRGEVESIFSTKLNDQSTEHLIFAGLSYSNGCAMIRWDGGNCKNYNENPFYFAQGYTIKGVHGDENGLLALAAGHDGVLLYDLNINAISFRGRINTSYANSVKVAGNIIFVATEDGLEIIQVK